MDRSLWKKFTDIVSSAIPLALFTLVAYAEVFFFVSGGFFETGRQLYGSSLFSVLLLTVTSGLTLYFGVSLYLALYRPEVSRNGTVVFIAELLSAAVGVAIPIILYYARTFEAATLLVTLPYFLAGLGAAVTLLLIPLARKRKVLVVIAAAVFVFSICGFAAVTANGREVRFEADPVVFDTGDGFSVVWCTNVTTIGYLEYSYGGEDYKVYDAEDGKYRADKRVHSVRVPYEHLYGNDYTVSVAKVLKNASRFSEVGEVVTSKSYTFAEKVTGDELKLLSLTDWHEKVDKLYAVAEGQEYDVLLMMGDAINYVNEFDDILNNIVIPGGKLTGGVKPVLFARGNHEVRGKYAGEIRSVLGLDEYYYTATYGEVNFIVFDGADDKADDDPQNGILTVCEAYREEELAAMEALPVLSSGYNICLCHIPYYAIGKDAEDAPPPHAAEQRARFTAILEKQNVKLEISGHEHYLEYVEGDSFDTLIAGGPTSDGYVACMITVKGGVANVVAYTAEKTVATYGPIALD